jgi:hypothetical protein
MDLGDVHKGDARRADRDAGAYAPIARVRGDGRERLRREEIRKIAHPCAELTGRCARGVVERAWEQAEDAVGEEVSDGGGHAGKPREEEVSRVLAEEGERRAGVLSCVCPGIVMVQP